MQGLLRTVATEMQSLVMGVSRRGTTRAARAAAATEQVALDVLGRDVASVSRKARSLASLPVQLKGEANEQMRFAFAKAEPQTLGERFTANRVAGDKREGIVEAILGALFPQKQGYVVRGEQYLRDRKLNIAIDQTSGQSRRIDFAVFKGDQILKLFEVTSQKASKVAQLAKESRMRRAGARWMQHPVTGERLRIPAMVKTELLRLP